MHIVYDGIIFELQSQGGISRIFEEIIPRVCLSLPQAEVELHNTSHLIRVPPKHARLRVRQIPSLEYYLRPRRFMSRFRRSVRDHLLSAISHTSNSLWHSTYFTQPTIWRGKRIVTVHDMNYELLPTCFVGKHSEEFRKRKMKQVADADLVVCISESTRQDVHRLYGTDLEKLRCVYPAYSSTLFYRQTKESDDSLLLGNNCVLSKPFLLYVGSRDAYKNFSTLLSAYSTWHHRNEVDLVVVGRAWDREEISEIQSKKLESQVHILSGVDDHQLRLLYNTAATFVYPSCDEGFGIPLLEAMACGCPIVASHIPIFHEVAQDYPVYFSPSSEEELQVALTDAVEKGRDEGLFQPGQKILEAFSWEKTAQGYINVYTELV